MLVLGETGTGKELIARAIHYNGPRADQPFVSENCGAIAPDLLTSELFGHKRGAFTGATEDRKGLFEIANKGTIFLDEIGDCPPDLQTRLLRVLDQGEIRRVGDNAPIKIDVRVIAATHHDLEKDVDAGRFRKDLFYRLSVFTITLPPLRERKDDIPMLAQHFLAQLSRASGRRVLGFMPEALAVLSATTTRATCASSRTRSSGRMRLPTPTSRSPPTCSRRSSLRSNRSLWSRAVRSGRRSSGSKRSSSETRSSGTRAIRPRPRRMLATPRRGLIDKLQKYGLR